MLPEESTIPPDTPPAEPHKIHLHLDGSDFAGFSLRLLELGLPTLLLTWLTGWDGAWVWFSVLWAWGLYLAYRLAQLKEGAYRHIIAELEARNEKLSKANQLLQNVVQDRLGMRVKVEE